VENRWQKLEYFDLLLGWLFGIASLAIAQVIGYYLSKRNLKEQQEHSEKILRMQLYRKDKKKALIKLDELLKKQYKTFYNFSESVESFLDGSTGMFLPDKLKKELKKEIWSINAFLSEKRDEIYGPEPEYPDDYEDWLQAISPEEALDEQITTRLRGLKTLMRDKIRKYVSEE